MNRKRSGIACVDLFCGAGGLSHGLIRSGIWVSAGIDADEECRFPYEENNRTFFLRTDIRGLDARTIRPYLEGGRFSMLAACAPCQPFSTYARRKGRGVASRDRWSLLRELARLVLETSPDFVTMENVPQLVHQSVFPEFLETLSKYFVWHGVIECSRFGVPQTRKRLVLLASRWGHVSLVEPDGESRATVRSAISHLPPLSAGCSDPEDPLHAACSLTPLNLRRIRASRPGGTWRDWSPALRANCHAKESGTTYPGVYGRMEWDKPGPTITTQCFGYGNGRFGHPDQDRAISLREAAALQTFPASYRFLRPGQPPRFNVIGRLIGNAVPVMIGEAIGRAFLEHANQIKR